MSSLIARISSLVTRFSDFVEARNQRAVNAWGASLQYKRRYTNPDDAKLYRRAQ